VQQDGAQQVFAAAGSVAGSENDGSQHWARSVASLSLASDPSPYGGFAVSEERLPRHALRVGDPLFVRLGVAAGGPFRFDDRPLGPVSRS